MFENFLKFFKKFSKENNKDSKDTAKERLHLVLMQDRANVSADFLEMMKQEIIEVIKKYIDVDENSIDVKLTNKVNSDGTTGAPALYANIPIVSLKDETKNINIERKLNQDNKENISSNNKENNEDKVVEKEEVKKEVKEEVKEDIKEDATEQTEQKEEIVEENMEKQASDCEETKQEKVNEEEKEEVKENKVTVSENENKE